MSTSRTGRKGSAPTPAADEHQANSSKKLKTNADAKEAATTSSASAASADAGQRQGQESASIADKDRAPTATVAPASPNQASRAAHRSDGDALEAADQPAGERAADLVVRVTVSPALDSDPHGALSRDEIRVDHITSLQDLPIKHACDDRACSVDIMVLGREQLASGHLLFYIVDSSARTFIRAEPAIAVIAADHLPIGSVR